ncbi:MAG: HAD family phosphatase [Candidatus Omnitrophica bacterium]|nr:HAD family phosphatase [Candidatus Omnitrophota bacterium]
MFYAASGGALGAVKGCVEMKSPDYDAILFDLGRVLVNFDHHVAAKRTAEYTDMDEAKIFETYFDSDLTDLFERGKITAAEFFERLKSLLRLDLDYDKFLPIWNDIFFKNNGMDELLTILKPHYRLVLISNINKPHFDYIKERFPILDHLDKIVVSYKVGARKPDPLIYETALKAAGTEASRTVYTDDRADLIEASSSIGMKNIQFINREQFNNDLKNLGILS